MTNADVPETKVGDMISRQVAIDALCTQRGILYPISTIEELPSAERKGKWINHRNDDGHNIADCSVCGNVIQWFDNDEKPRYCCMCGARMESEESKCSEE